MPGFLVSFGGLYKALGLNVSLEIVLKDGEVKSNMNKMFLF